MPFNSDEKADIAESVKTLRDTSERINEDQEARRKLQSRDYRFEEPCFNPTSLRSAFGQDSSSSPACKIEQGFGFICVLQGSDLINMTISCHLIHLRWRQSTRQA